MSQFRTRALASVAAAASLSVLLAACGGGDSDSATKTTKGKVTLGLYSWLQQAQTARDMNTLVLTGSLLSIVPLAVFMFALQKYWRSGILMGSLK